MLTSARNEQPSGTSARPNGTGVGGPVDEGDIPEGRTRDQLHAPVGVGPHPPQVRDEGATVNVAVAVAVEAHEVAEWQARTRDQPRDDDARPLPVCAAGRATVLAEVLGWNHDGPRRHERRWSR